MKNIPQTLRRYFHKAGKAAFALIAPTQTYMTAYDSVIAKTSRTFSQTCEMTNARVTLMPDFTRMTGECLVLSPRSFRKKCARSRGQPNRWEICTTPWEAYADVCKAVALASEEVFRAEDKQEEQRSLLARQRKTKIYDLPTAQRLDAASSRLWEANLALNERMIEVAEAVIAIMPVDSHLAHKAWAILASLSVMPTLAQTRWQHRQPGTPEL